MVKNVFQKDATFVALVEVSSHLDYSRIPHMLDYNHPNIKNVIPCEKRGSSYYDLRSGKEVEKKAESLEWPILTGTVFRYPDGKQFLVSRVFSTREMLFMETTEYRPTSMVRHDIKEAPKTTD